MIGKIVAKAVKKIHEKGKSAVFEVSREKWESAAHLGNIRVTGQVVDLENLEPITPDFRNEDVARPILDLLEMKLSWRKDVDRALKKAFIRAYLKEYTGREPPEDLVNDLIQKEIKVTAMSSNYEEVKKKVINRLKAFLSQR